MKKITVIALLLAAALGAQARNGSGKPAYKDAGRPVEERVSDLLSRMTLEEKIGQMCQLTAGGIRVHAASPPSKPRNKIGIFFISIFDIRFSGISTQGLF